MLITGQPVADAADGVDVEVGGELVDFFAEAAEVDFQGVAAGEAAEFPDQIEDGVFADDGVEIVGQKFEELEFFAAELEFATVEAANHL